MSNKQVYATGLLNRALDSATQPPEIRAFLQAEIDLLNDIVVEGMSMIDVECGTGRHLTMLRNRLRTGVGVDYEHAHPAIVGNCFTGSSSRPSPSIPPRTPRWSNMCGPEIDADGTTKYSVNLVRDRKCTRVTGNHTSARARRR
jgi:hypothetical protein